AHQIGVRAVDAAFDRSRNDQAAHPVRKLRGRKLRQECEAGFHRAVKSGEELTRGLLALALLLVLAVDAGAAENPGLKSGVFSPPRPAPDFSLRGSDGAEFKLSRYRGKVVALGFGYTFCPDVCPTTLLELAQVRKSLGADGRELQV